MLKLVDGKILETKTDTIIGEATKEQWDALWEEIKASSSGLLCEALEEYEDYCDAQEKGEQFEGCLWVYLMEKQPEIFYNALVEAFKYRNTTTDPDFDLPFEFYSNLCDLKKAYNKIVRGPQDVDLLRLLRSIDTVVDDVVWS